MGRMKEVYVEITDMLDCLGNRYENLQHVTERTDKRIDGLLHLMTDMVKMEDQIRKMEENIEIRLSRMEAAQVDSGKLVDRLIEMTLVQSGQSEQAVLHRAQSRLDSGFFDRPHDRIEDQEDVWPPPGCDAMESIG